jgi:hypothetical protein
MQLCQIKVWNNNIMHDYDYGVEHLLAKKL